MIVTDFKTGDIFLCEDGNIIIPTHYWIQSEPDYDSWLLINKNGENLSSNTKNKSSIIDFINNKNPIELMGNLKDKLTQKNDESGLY